MPNYVVKSLQRLHYNIQVYPQYSPHEHTPIVYGTKGTQQYATAPDISVPLAPKETTWLQSVVGSFLYYSIAIDNTILPALNELSSAQAQPTQKTKTKAQRLMDYLNTYPVAFLRYHASDMVLHVDTDTAYLVVPKAKSRVAGYFYLSD